MAYLTSGEVEELFSLAHHQLDYWVTSGLVTPTVEAEGQGYYRRWSVRDAVKVGIIVALKGEGVPLQTIRKSMRNLWGVAIAKGGFQLVYPGAGYIDVDAVRGRVERAFQRQFPEMEVESDER